MTKNSYYEYVVKVWDELDEEVVSCQGVTYAALYSKAVQNIEEYYGKENIQDIKIQTIESSPVYDFKDESSNAFFKITVEEENG